MRNNKGITLVELLVASTILGGLVVAYLQFFQLTRRTVSIVTAKSDLARSLLSIEQDIMEDVPYIPSQRRPMNEFDALRDGNNNTTHPLLADSQQAVPERGERCYDRFGGRLDDCNGWATNRAMVYRARFFKNWVLDRSVADQNSALARLPMSLVQFRVDYKIDNQVTQEPIYFTRLYTETMLY